MNAAFSLVDLLEANFICLIIPTAIQESAITAATVVGDREYLVTETTTTNV
jgi:hypothetical protein